MAVYYSELRRDVAHTARVSCQDIYSSATKLIVLTIILCASFGVPNSTKPITCTRVTL